MTKKLKLEITKLKLLFGERIIFHDLNLQKFSGDKLVIVGENGVGKSTLLKIIKGSNYNFSGSVKTEGLIGYLPQAFEDFLEKSAFENLINETNNFDLVNLWKEKENLNKEEWEKKFNFLGGFQLIKLLSQLNISPPQLLDRKLESLSGGEKVKLHLAALCFQNPDILLLDEPTNNLDEAGLNWLEKFLKDYSGILIMVTHDRYLINQTANYISELTPENHNLTHFNGNYWNYLQEKEKQYKRLKQKRNEQEKEIKFIGEKLTNLHLKKSSYLVNKVKRRENKMGFDARGARKQKSHKRIVNQLKVKKINLSEKLVKVPFFFRRKLEIDSLSENVSLPKDISICLKNIEKSYQEKILFKKLSFEIHSGEKILIKGINGAGKSSLLKIIMGIISADEGTIIIPEQVKLGYLEQEQESLNLNQKIIEFLINNPLIELNEKQLREKLEIFGIFYPQELTLPLSRLSIGCRRKLQIVQIILQGANFLILDEPTNHIDLLSLEKIEELLIDFPGPILVASHDRYFIKKICNRVINIEDFK